MTNDNKYGEWMYTTEPRIGRVHKLILIYLSIQTNLIIHKLRQLRAIQHMFTGQTMA